MTARGSRTRSTRRKPKRRYVRRLFATIADRYDFITRFLSFGRDRHWKTTAVDLAGVQPGVARAWISRAARATSRSKRRGAASACVGLDITHADDRARARRRPQPADGTAWVVGDMLALPVPDGVVRRGHDGLRAAQRARSAARAVGDPSRARARRRGCVRSTSIARRRPGCATIYLGVPDGRRARRSAGCCTAIRTRIATFPRRFAAIPARAASSTLMRRPASATCGTSRSSAASWRFTSRETKLVERQTNLVDHGRLRAPQANPQASTTARKDAVARRSDVDEARGPTSVPRDVAVPLLRQAAGRAARREPAVHGAHAGRQRATGRPTVRRTPSSSSCSTSRRSCRRWSAASASRAAVRRVIVEERRSSTTKAVAELATTTSRSFW